MLVGGVLAVGLLATGLVLDASRVAATRARLTSAGDAAALAAAPLTFARFGTTALPERAAAETAFANGAQLEQCRCDIDRTWRPRTVVVTVSAEVELLLLPDRSLRAKAAAEFRPVDLARG